MNKIKIQRRKFSKTGADYFFTALPNKIVLVSYDSEWDFYGTPSGASHIEVEIPNNNSFILRGVEDVSIEEVPQAIIDLLTFLNDYKHS